MTQGTVRRENHALRTITAVMMFFIALTHYYSQFKVGDIFVLGKHLMSVGRFVIPVFVLLSGYFCYSKDGHSEANIGKKMMHIIFLIVIFKLVYLIFSSILCLAGIVDLNYVLTEFLTVSPPFEFDCYGGTMSIMTTQPIWFIYGLFLIYGLFFLLYRFKVDFKWTWLIAIPVLIAMLLVDLLPMFGIEYIGDLNIDEGIGGILYPFIIFPFFTMGYYLHKDKEKIDAKLSDKMIWIAIFGGFALMIAEMAIRPDHYNSCLYLGSFIFIMAVFIGSFRVPEDRARCSVMEYIGKYLTMWMYVFFGCANFIVRYSVQPFADNELIPEVIGPFAALLLDIAMAFAFHQFLRYMAIRKKQKIIAQKENAVVE